MTDIQYFAINREMKVCLHHTSNFNGLFFRNRRKASNFMKIENNKIVEATENELFDYYLRVGWDDVMSFPDYSEHMKDKGVIIRGEQKC